MSQVVATACLHRILQIVFLENACWVGIDHICSSLFVRLISLDPDGVQTPLNSSNVDDIVIKTNASDFPDNLK